MKQIKICPDCTTEYFPHIERCADCGSVLLTPEEIKKTEEEKKRCMEKSLENSVVVREGSLNWMNELYDVLIESSISGVVNSDAGCKKGCCGDTYRLLVSSQVWSNSRKNGDEDQGCSVKWGKHFLERSFSKIVF